MSIEKGGESIKYEATHRIKLSGIKKVRKEKLDTIEFLLAIDEQIEKNKNEIKKDKNERDLELD